MRTSESDQEPEAGLTPWFFVGYVILSWRLHATAPPKKIKDGKEFSLMFRSRYRFTWRTFLIQWVLLMVVSFLGCSSDSDAPGKNDPLETSVTVFGDVHFTPFYDPTLFFDLVDAPVNQWRISLVDPR